MTNLIDFLYFILILPIKILVVNYKIILLIILLIILGFTIDFIVWNFTKKSLYHKFKNILKRC